MTGMVCGEAGQAASIQVRKVWTKQACTLLDRVGESMDSQLGLVRSPEETQPLRGEQEFGVPRSSLQFCISIVRQAVLTSKPS